jgi:hypothetical protein
LDGRPRRSCKTDRANGGADRADGFRAKPPPAANLTICAGRRNISPTATTNMRKSDIQGYQ